MLTKNQKKKILEDLNARFDKQKIAIFTDIRGVGVSKAQTLRRSLKKADAEYKVAKKTLIDKAISEHGFNYKTQDIEGEIGIAFGYGDQVEPAKELLKFGRENETFKVLGGILDGKVLSAKDITVLAMLPFREVLLAQVVGAMQGPIRGLVTVLNVNMRNLVVVLTIVKDQK